MKQRSAPLYGPFGSGRTLAFSTILITTFKLSMLTVTEEQHARDCKAMIYNNTDNKSLQGPLNICQFLTRDTYRLLIQCRQHVVTLHGNY